MPQFDENVARIGCFAAVLIGMAVWELLAPRRRLSVRKGPRWLCHLMLVSLNTLALRLLMPLSLVAAAGRIGDRGWGALQGVDWPAWIEVPVAIALFDLLIYGQHVLFHRVPLFWWVHRVHHADLDYDVTTGIRFHTVEIVMSGIVKLAALVLLGASPLAVLLFEIQLNATSLFNHSNVRLPPGLDRLLRLVVVTPDMHRVHHSVIRQETDSNFGFSLPWWDYLFGTYRDQPEAGHEEMLIGLPEFRDERQTERLGGLLWLPMARGGGSGSSSVDAFPPGRTGSREGE